MFDLTATPVTFVGLLVMFAWCTLWCLYELTRPQGLRQRVSNSLHLVMAVVMLAMVARPTWQGLTAVVPMPALAVIFGAATLWFGWLALDSFTAGSRSGGWHFLGHAAMFAAMAWHVAAMAAMSAGMTAMSGQDDHSSMPGMGGGGEGADPATWMEAQRSQGGLLWGFAVVGLPLMAYLLVAGVAALRQIVAAPVPGAAGCSCGQDCDCEEGCGCQSGHFSSVPVQRELALVNSAGSAQVAAPLPEPVNHSCHELRPVGSLKYRLAAAGDASMNLGMFWMSAGLMTPLLPFFAMLAF